MIDAKIQYLTQRDRIVFNVVCAHVPFIGLVGAIFGHLAVGLAVSISVAALGAVALSKVRGTRGFGAIAGMLLMADSGGLIAASGGQIAMHFHVFIVITFLIFYFDWLPIVAATVTIAVHHVVGNVLFPQAVFGDMAAMGNTWVMVVEHAVAVVLEAGAAIYVAVRIRNRVRAVAHVAEHIARQQMPEFRQAIVALADGDLTHETHFNAQRLAVDRSDEIGLMVATFEVMQNEIADSVAAFEQTRRALDQIVSGIVTTASQLALASTEFSVSTSGAGDAVEVISRSCQRVADGTHQQAQQLDGAGAALRELVASTAQIATGAQEQTSAVRSVLAEVHSLDDNIATVASLATTLAAAATLATAETANGIEAVAKTAQAVQLSRDLATQTEKLMTSLEVHSSAVEQIVRVIDDISDQTNLLALNAAIEAARAGDQGRGFAIVADEVRTLAERSATSTSEIEQVLSVIRRETIAAVASMRASKVELEQGFALANRSQSALGSIEHTIAETSRVASRILAGSETMRTASARAKSSMENVSAISEQNASAAAAAGSTTAAVGGSLALITDHSQAQSAAAGDVSASVLSLAAEVQEIAATAQQVHGQAEALHAIVRHFQIAAV